MAIEKFESIKRLTLPLVDKKKGKQLACSVLLYSESPRLSHSRVSPTAVSNKPKLWEASALLMMRQRSAAEYGTFASSDNTASRTHSAGLNPLASISFAFPSSPRNNGRNRDAELAENDEENLQESTSQPQEANNEEERASQNNEDEDEDEFYRGGLAQMTRQLRCLFSTITWPIIPLGAVVSFSLTWVLYAAFLLDVRRNCSHPLHWYAMASLVLVTYTPFHAQARSHLFHYSRERDGPVRPAGVRMYDQLFHTICLLYVYGGVTLIQTCKEDVASAQVVDVVNKDGTNNGPVSLDPPSNSCAATCPHLYHSLVFYITTLELFTFSLILPLLFLPCIYVWFLRRATSDYETLAHFRERLEEEEALLSNGGITAEEILQSLEDVKLVFNPTKPGAEVLILPKLATDFSGGSDGTDIKECCICMNDFHVQDDINAPLHDDHEVGEIDLENGLCTSIAPSSTPQDDMVRTKCGHVFHRKCLAGWIGGRWEGNPQLVVPENDSATTTTTETSTLSTTAVTTTTTTTTRRQRKARRTCCPLCRYDLRSSIGTSSQ